MAEPLYCSGCGVEIGDGCECTCDDEESGQFCEVCGTGANPYGYGCEYCSDSPSEQASDATETPDEETEPLRADSPQTDGAGRKEP